MWAGEIVGVLEAAIIGRVYTHWQALLHGPQWSLTKETGEDPEKMLLMHRAGGRAPTVGRAQRLPLHLCNKSLIVREAGRARRLLDFGSLVKVHCNWGKGTKKKKAIL